jgi:hypothetical protein
VAPIPSGRLNEWALWGNRALNRPEAREDLFDWVLPAVGVAGGMAAWGGQHVATVSPHIAARQRVRDCGAVAAVGLAIRAWRRPLRRPGLGLVFVILLLAATAASALPVVRSGSLLSD